MHNQPLVVRAFFNSKSEVEMASSLLDDIGVWNDTLAGPKNDPYPHKLILTDTSLIQAKVSLRRISVKPALVQVFDPQDNLEGWPDFKTITL